MVETALFCMLLIMFLLVFIETFYVIQSKIYIQRIARETVREAAINYQGQGMTIAENKAYTLAVQFLKTNDINVELNQSGDIVACHITYQYPLFTKLKDHGYGGGIILNGKAVFPLRVNT